MIRTVNQVEVKYGHFAEYLELCEELDAASVAKGFLPTRNLTPMVGQNNIIIHECDYDSLQQMKDEETKFYADADLMKTMRRGAELIVQGSAISQILEEAPHLA